MVIPTYLGECQKCNNCISGKTNLCETYPLQVFTGLMPDGTSRMSIITSGSCQKLYQFLSCSTWSQYTIVDAKYVVKMDSRLSLPHASFLSCGFTTGFGATWKEAKVEKRFYRSYFQSWRCWTGSKCNINMPNIRTRDRYG